MTPYVTPRWRSAGNGRAARSKLEPQNQLAREIAQRASYRCLPMPTEIAIGNRIGLRRGILRGAFFRPLEVLGKLLADAIAVGARLIFPEPVWGPLAFGFGAHFGLGLFRQSLRRREVNPENYQRKRLSRYSHRLYREWTRGGAWRRSCRRAAGHCQSHGR